MNFIKILVFSFVALTISACQPTGIRSLSGATKTAFEQVNPKVPAGWTKYTRGSGVIVYKCAEENCAERGEIAYSAMLEKENAEAMMRAIMTSGNLLRDMGSMLTVVSNGTHKQIEFSNLTNDDYVAFERVYSVKKGSETSYYIMRRTVKGNQSKIISASAPTLPKARQYLKIALAVVKE